MKIALCNVQEFNPKIGGIERVSVSLATQLIKQDVEVIFVSCRKSPYIEEYTLPAKQYTLPSTNDYSIENVGAMAELLQKQKVEIFVNQNAHSLAYHRTCHEVCEKTGIKLVSVLHFNPDMRIKAYHNMIDGRFFNIFENLKYVFYSMLLSYPLTLATMHDHKTLYKSLYKDSSKVVLLSTKFKQIYAKIAGLNELSKLVAVPNMLSFSLETACYEKENTIVWCGRIMAQKNPYRALYVWEKISKRLPDWKLQMIGDGIWFERIKALASDMKLERIEFLGFKNPVDYYKTGKLFMLTSNYEGWALTLTEAMQYGCVPVAFNSYESITDIIDHEKTGVLVKPFDIEEMADAIVELAKSNTLSSMSVNTQKTMSRFTPDTVCQKWIDIFNDVLK